MKTFKKRRDPQQLGTILHRLEKKTTVTHLLAISGDILMEIKVVWKVVERRIW